jgi:hypothetical protein
MVAREGGEESLGVLHPIHRILLDPLLATAPIPDQQGAYVVRRINKTRSVDTGPAPVLRESKDKEMPAFLLLSWPVLWLDTIYASHIERLSENRCLP